MHKNIKELVEYPREGILSKSVINREKMDVTLFCMAKGAEMSEHTSTKQGLVYVIEGKGVFNLEGEEIAMEPGTLIQMDQNAVHSLKTDENTAFLLTLVK